MLTVFAVTLLFAIVLFAQGQNAFSQTNPQKVQFAKLTDYVDSSKRRRGDRLIIDDVPPVEKISYEKVEKMYFFQPVENGGNANDFYTSAALAKGMRPHLQSNTTSMRVTCMLIDFGEGIDVLRSPFATKIEGLDENGIVIWTATGPPPSKLKFSQ